ncbi:hypothetical protein COS33_00965 [Candidatus Wolfebacteria bacterium CG02_land_8_20_14_3_00_37_12]|nr:MAG: hypothetical protein COS33_00965 [Candidatus Wolfebacteria bacterium CG02_land_8_20_14_3_00_37_12]PJA41771.1 MAG: hypothetical protein CO177_00680 [Candidatus Wolfebacteria bacterium CG_4_9_14_3_um_filter_37_9]
MFGIQFNLKKFGIGLAIVIVFNLFINYGINTFYKSPKYEDFCNPERLKQSLNTRESCEVVGGLWTENVGYETKRLYAPISESAPLMPAEKPIPIVEIQNQQPSGWCDQDFSCRKDFDKVNDVYRRNVFVVWIIAGIAAIIASFSFTAVQILSTSFMFSGLLALLIGTIQYWSAMQDYLRFIILGIALGILVYLAYKKLK